MKVVINMKNKFLKILSLFLAFVMIICCACGCNSSSTNSSLSSTDGSSLIDSIASEITSSDDSSSETSSDDSSSESSSSDDSSSKPSTSEPSSSKPSSSKPSTSKPSTSKPSTSKPSTSKPSTSKPSTSKPSDTEPESNIQLNGADLSEYVIVHRTDAPDHEVRAAEYIRDQIKERTGIQLTVVKDNIAQAAEEIVVGDTSRPISDTIEAPKKSFDFYVVGNGTNIAMEANSFAIAAAAYYFVDKYITGETFKNTVPSNLTLRSPIVEKPENYVLLIGDGMGVPQTKLFGNNECAGLTGQLDEGQDVFYGYYFPYAGYSRTDSLSGTTDSAAGGTALATGYSTTNGRIGMDKNANSLQSLTELAGSLGMSTAVMSTDSATGATPASFSAHAVDRTMSSEIAASQKQLQNKYGTIISCGLNNASNADIKKEISSTLDELSKNDNGFFIMYEEGYIDKHSHNNDSINTLSTVIRFNEAISVFMEYAFYNPATFVLITADHETGNMKLNTTTNQYYYTSGGHSSQDVPIFAYGLGADVFHQKTIKNIQIPKTVAAFLGKKFGDQTATEFPSLK